MSRLPEQEDIDICCDAIDDRLYMREERAPAVLK
jgi:hypothetical protein